MAYLKINKALRAIFFTIGLFGIIYGINDIQSEEAGRKGLNSTPENAPFSYYFTVGKKLIFGTIFVVIAASPILGESSKN